MKSLEDFLNGNAMTRAILQQTGLTLAEVLQHVNIEPGDPLIPESWPMVYPADLIEPMQATVLHPLAVLVWFYQTTDMPEHRIAAGNYLRAEAMGPDYQLGHSQRKKMREFSVKQNDAVREANGPEWSRQDDAINTLLRQGLSESRACLVAGLENNFNGETARRRRTRWKKE